jgi:hypothetical protein
MIEAAYETPVDDTRPAKAAAIREEISRLTRIEERAHENMRDPDYPRQQGKQEWQEAQRSRRDAEFRLAQIEQSAPHQIPTKGTIQTLAHELASHEPETWEDKQTFVRLLVREIRVNATDLHIECLIPENLVPAPWLSNGDCSPGSSWEQKGNRVSDSPEYGHQKPYTSPLSLPISFKINALL